jgi:hypothetical protein
MSLWRWEMCTLRYGAHVAPASLNTEVGLAGGEAIHALWRLKVTPQLLLALLWIAVAALVMLEGHVDDVRVRESPNYQLPGSIARLTRVRHLTPCATRPPILGNFDNFEQWSR